VSASIGRVIALTVSIIGGVPARAGPAPTIASCDAGLAQRGPRIDRYACYFAAARAQKSWPAARARLEAALSIDPGNDAARIVLAGVAADLQSPEADGIYRKAITGFVGKDDAYAETRSRVWYAMFLGFHGRPAEADEQLTKAAQAAQRSGDAVVLARVDAQRGWWAFNLADYAAARAAFDRAGTVALEGGPDDLASNVAGGLGAVAWATGRFREGMDAYLRDAERCAERGESFEESTQRLNAAVLAGQLLGQGEISVSEVTTLVRAAIDSAVRSGNAAAEAAAVLLYRRLDGVPREERDRLTERALAIGRRLGHLRIETQALRALAVHRMELGAEHADEALALADEAIAAAKARELPDEVVRGMLARNYVLWRAGRRPAAIAACDASFDVLDSLRGAQGDDLIGAQHSAGWAPWYAKCVGKVLGEGHPSTDDVAIAFRWTERMRNRAHREALGRAKAGHEDEATAELASIDSVRGSLSPDEAMLVFQLSTRLRHQEIVLNGDLGGSWVFVIDRNGARVLPLGESTDLDARIELYLGLVAGNDPGAWRAGRRLYMELIEPAVRELAPTVRRLVVLPDRGMHRLPIGALPVGDGDARLASRFEISIPPSASIWQSVRAFPGAPQAALAVADPETTGSQQVAVFRASYGRIPRAVEEGRWVVRLLGAGSRMVTAGAASERLVKTTDFSRYGLVHFAAHAVIDDAHPDRSAIVLAPGDPSEDGLLTVREIAALDLQGRVVILSACSSAGGEVLRGEGVFGLTRAFFQAGARAVVASLWPLRDNDAAAFVTDLARGLAAGRRLSDALACAQRVRIADKAPDSVWAGFQLFGDGDVVVAPGGSGTAWVQLARARDLPIGWIALGVAAIGVAFAARRRLTEIAGR